jgi:hypothetical protein
MPLHAHLTKGVNLMGVTASVNMEPGEALDAMNILPRVDGSIMRHWGARRLNSSALTGEILSIKGFTYKGKNNDTTTNPGRDGNYGADDGAIFTRRVPFYSGALVLTDTGAFVWDPSTRAFSSALTLPGGVSVDPLPRPTMLVVQNNVYIVGWASHNLRYDPVDQALYIWGWDSTPSITGGSVAVGAGGTLRPSAIYKYRAAWVDLYTGEQSELSDPYEATTTASNRTVTFSAGAFAAYAGTRHFVDGVNATNQDVGLILYRTEPNEEAFYFLDLLTPGLAAETLVDNGLSTDMRRKATILGFDDPKRYSGAGEYRNQMFGISWAEGEGMTRLFYNDFTATKSHRERTQALNFRELPLTNGEFLTAVAPIDEGVVVFSNKDAYMVASQVNQTLGIVTYTLDPLRWGVGAVGPRAWCYNGWLYFLSERGPYRWRPGLPEPQWIGKNQGPLFIDPMSGMCKLNPAARAKSEVFYDPDADVVRFLFPTGNSTYNNEHFYYWNKPEFNNGNIYQGWFFGQKKVLTADYTHAFGGLNLDTGAPESQLDRAAHMVFGDELGYVYEYDPILTSWVPEPMQGYFLATDGTSTTIEVDGGLYTTDDGLAGLMVEVAHLASGTVETRIIASNTSTEITVTEAWDETPVAGDRLWIGGFMSYWRSWLDHGGEPSLSKVSVHLSLGLQQTGNSDSVVDVTMAAGDDIPGEPLVELTVVMSKNNHKVVSSLVGRWFIWEIANSRPYEPFHLTYIKTDLRALSKERL